MSPVHQRHVEALALTSIILGVIILETLILPQTPKDAFATSDDSHAVYEGSLTQESQTRKGFRYTGELCKDIHVWNREALPINDTVRITGQIQDNMLFAETVEKTS